jgi:hypothetical protein
MQTTTTLPPCRLYVLVATHAPVALVVRRGPSIWWHLLRWDLDRLTLEPGAWLKGTLYPRRSDISPDGRLFGYFALRSSPPPWDTYFAVAKLPWLTALAAWRTSGTWTGGCEFDRHGRLTIEGCLYSEPFHGHYPKTTLQGLRTDWVGRDLRNELKRGWQVLADDQGAPARAALPAAVRPTLLIRRPQPGNGGAALILAHAGVDFARPSIEGAQVHYLREAGDGRITPLPEAAWADWDHHGRLLMATAGGVVCIEEPQGGGWARIWSQDLRDLAPAPVAAPDWAQKW